MLFALVFVGQGVTAATARLELCLIGDELGAPKHRVDLLDEKTKNQLGQFLAVLNNHPGIWFFDLESSVLKVDFAELERVLGESSYLGSGERTAIVQLAHAYHDKPLALVLVGCNSSGPVGVTA